MCVKFLSAGYPIQIGSRFRFKCGYFVGAGNVRIIEKVELL
jgi:hypothetical protein